MRVPPIWIALTMTLTAAGAAAADVRPGPLPSRLECRAVSCVYGDDCRPKDYSAIALWRIDASSVSWGDEAGVVTGDDEEDKLVFDFSDGDQYASFRFLGDDVAAMAAGKLKSIKGLYEEGFEWSDGYHTHALYVVQCVQPPAEKPLPKKGDPGTSGPRRRKGGQHGEKD